LKKCHKGSFQVISKDESELFGINKENMPINPGTKFFPPTPEEREHGKKKFTNFKKRTKSQLAYQPWQLPPYGQFKLARVKIANVP
jgi:hypothetical protein